MDAYHVSGTNQIKSKASLRLLSHPLVLSRVLVSPSPEARSEVAGAGALGSGDAVGRRRCSEARPYEVESGAAARSRAELRNQARACERGGVGVAGRRRAGAAQHHGQPHPAQRKLFPSLSCTRENLGLPRKL
jgi:hypothetical protein